MRAVLTSLTRLASSLYTSTDNLKIVLLRRLVPQNEMGLVLQPIPIPSTFALVEKLPRSASREEPTLSIHSARAHRSLGTWSCHLTTRRKCTFPREHQSRRRGTPWLLCQSNFAGTNDLDLQRFRSRRRRHVLTDVLEHGRVT